MAINAPTFDPIPALSEELALPASRVAAVLQMLEEGNTVPFLARYRKEATGGMDEVQIRGLEEGSAAAKQLHERKLTILESIDSQGKLSDELRRKVLGCDKRTELEDLYLPYKPKRRTRATIARERGLEPLAERILAQEGAGDPLAEAARFVDPDKEVPDAAAALAGARDIVAEHAAEDPTSRARLRKLWLSEAVLVSKVIPGKAEERTKFEQYYDFRERLATIPSHRFLAVRRGERDGVLRLTLEVDPTGASPILEQELKLSRSSPWADTMREALKDGYSRLIAPSLDTELRVDRKLLSDRGAVEVFADNLRELLLAAPLGERSVLGIDPGLRTGCKCAVVDATGKFLGHHTLYLVQNEAKARKELLQLMKHFSPAAIAVGNGTGGRETEAFVRSTLREGGIEGVIVVSVNESGASIYSASDIAREEFPDLDLTIRGAISIAHRLQDPLAELVKIDPKSIGVGQYQHDVHQPLLQRKLVDVVESCVNQVGVELNTASAPLLSRVAGIGPRLAKAIVDHREKNGAFASRKALQKVSGLGPRTFEQCAGFLRLRDGDHPLDSSAVHPERYPLVEKIARDQGTALDKLVGDSTRVRAIEVTRYVDDEVGEPTLRDILAELEKPGRDPREVFEPPKFREDVQKVEDLEEGMKLEGVVTNVTAFGAFVDVGVHQDGLVHVSQLADRYVSDPREVVKVGDKIQVHVLEVDLERGRISLSAKRDPEARRGGRPEGNRGSRPQERTAGQGSRNGGRGQGPQHRSRGPSTPAPKKKVEGHNNPLADLLKDFNLDDGKK